jgi:hypothetical protein
MKIKFEKVFWSLKKIKILVYWHRYSGKNIKEGGVVSELNCRKSWEVRGS